MNYPQDMKLIQDVDTRFATSHSLCDRFVDVNDAVDKIVHGSAHVHAAVTTAFDSILVERHGISKETVDMPALNAIVLVFNPIFIVQKALKADKTPTLHRVPPYLQAITRNLEDMCSPSSYSTQYTKTLATVTLENVLSMTDHPLHIASCLLLPSLCKMEFIGDSTRRATLVFAGMGQLRRLMALRNPRKEKIAVATVETQAAVTDQSGTAAAETSATSSKLKPAQRRAGAMFSLGAIADTPKQKDELAVDELTSYMNNTEIVKLFAENFDEDDTNAAPTVWLRRREQFLELCEVALGPHQQPLVTGQTL